jgi:site-specific DNA recombinase
MTVPLRAALYLRVSTARQAEHDVSIPDQKRQGEAYCASRGYQLVEAYVEPGASATNDRRPEFQRMIEAGTSKPAPFDVVIVHSFSRFFRDHFELEFYVRKLAKNGVKLVSITQEMGDDPMHVMMRQIMALFDEYQSKENAKHVMRALKENARQGFWNGSLPPIGYRVVAAEQRGAKVKKKLEIDPLHAVTVRLIYRLALHGDGAKGQMGVKNIVSYLNRNRIFTRDGGRWGIGQVHRILTRRTYMGEHEFNKRSKSKELKPVSEIVVVPVPPIIDRETFDAVQTLLKARHPTVTPSAVINGPTLLTGLIHCAKCGGAMTIRTGKGGRYRYYACSMKARQGPTACEGMAVPMDKLDDLVASHLEERLLQPERLEAILAMALDRRQERSERQREHIGELNRRAAESEARLKRLYDAIEAGVANLDDPALKDRIDGLKAIRDQAKADAERAQAMLQNSGSQAVTPQMLSKFARTARQRIRLEGGGYRRDHLRALAQRVEVSDGEVRIMGSKSQLLQTLVANGGANAVPTQGLKWRMGWDSNPRYAFTHGGFQDRCLQPLGHPSVTPYRHDISMSYKYSCRSSMPAGRVHHRSGVRDCQALQVRREMARFVGRMSVIWKISGLVAAAGLAVISQCGYAQSAPNNVAAGRKLAEQYCVQCHVIAPGGNAGWTDAPAFDVIANREDTTVAKLSAFIQKPHMHMLNTGRGPSEANAIAAYIISLRKS